MTQRLEAEGLETVTGFYPDWDDGSDYDGVTKIYFGGGSLSIEFIQFEYVKDGQLKNGAFHGFSRNGFTKTFEIDHSNHEHLEFVKGYIDSTTGIRGIQFITNLRISEFMGYDASLHWLSTIGVKGKKIIGFHGTFKGNPKTLVPYLTLITPTKMESKGGKGGKEWDDGADYETVTKITVQSGFEGIQYIKFDYVDKDGQPKEGLIHGSNSTGCSILKQFEINHLDNEYLLSIDGYYDEGSGVIQALQFKTNMKTSEPMGYNAMGTKFSLGRNGNKIIGFHGYAETNLNSLGIYITSLPFIKLDSASSDLSDDGETGNYWDDGTFQAVRKVYAMYDTDKVMTVGFEYDNGGKVELREHGPNIVQTEQFVLDYPNEYITSVEGTITAFKTGTAIKSLTFKTSKGRTSPTYGTVSDKDIAKFVLESKGCAIVGFFGRTSSWYIALHAFGAYFYPMPFPNDVEKLDAQG